MVSRSNTSVITMTTAAARAIRNTNDVIVIKEWIRLSSVSRIYTRKYAFPFLSRFNDSFLIDK